MELKNYYLKEFSLYDGEFDITFNIIDVNSEKSTITVAISKAGKISVQEFDLRLDKDNNLYFFYGVDYEKVILDTLVQIFIVALFVKRYLSGMITITTKKTKSMYALAV